MVYVEEDCQGWVLQGGDVVVGQRDSDDSAAAEDVVSSLLDWKLRAKSATLWQSPRHINCTPLSVI